MPERDRVDAAAAGAFLRSRYGEGRVRELEPLAGGAWSAAYGFVLDDEPLVVRFGGYAEDFEKDQLMARLSRELPPAGRPVPDLPEPGLPEPALPAPALPAPDLPVPEVLELGAAYDGYFAVSRRAYGSFLDELSGPDMANALPSLLAALRTLRSIDPPGPGYGGFDLRGGACRSWQQALLSVTEDERAGGRLRGWRRRLAESPWGIEPFETGLRTLRSLTESLPADVPRRLIHNDLLHRNVLVADDGRIAAVFDWANAMYGDPVFDLAWLEYWWPWHSAWREIDIRKVIEPELAGLGPSEQVGRRMRCCLIWIGLEHQAYNAFVGDFDEVGRNIQRTLELTNAG